VSSQCLEFGRDPKNHAHIMAAGALTVESFYCFVNILRDHAETGLALDELAVVLKRRMGVEWKQGTAEINAKVMLNWARHTGLAPGVFQIVRGRRSRKRPATATALPLFDL
jgi:hypothetical protein